jgi:hypothetical protein
MSDARQTYAELFKLAQQSPEVEGIVKSSSSWGKALPWLAGGGALAAGVPLAYGAGRRKAEEVASKERPLVFGAGALTGATALPLLKKLKSSIGSLGLGPTLDSLGLNPGAMYDQFAGF